MPRSSAAEDRRDPCEGDRGVARLRLAEGLYPVRDRLYAAQRDGARRERSQHRKTDCTGERGVRPGEMGEGRVIRRKAARWPDAMRISPQPTSASSSRRMCTSVARRAARLADAAQVGDHDEREQYQRDADFVAPQRRDRRGDRGDAGGDRDRDRQRVVDHQRRGRRQ